jgi:hypothetical protein
MRMVIHSAHLRCLRAAAWRGAADVGETDVSNDDGDDDEEEEEDGVGDVDQRPLVPGHTPTQLVSAAAAAGSPLPSCIHRPIRPAFLHGENGGSFGGEGCVTQCDHRCSQEDGVGAQNAAAADPFVTGCGPLQRTLHQQPRPGEI